MRKSDELSNPNSCLNRSAPDEMLFVVCARDPAYGHTVREWALERVRLGINKASDGKIAGAYADALQVEREQCALSLNKPPPPRPTLNILVQKKTYAGGSPPEWRWLLLRLDEHQLIGTVLAESPDDYGTEEAAHQSACELAALMPGSVVTKS